MEQNKNNTPLSQHLRKNQTKEEAKLWYQFLRKYPIQFKRQYKIGDYIVDFYCHKAKLAVELDGSGHYEPEQIQKDQFRTKYINQQGISVLRFTNIDVQHNFYSVCTCIDEAVQKYKSEEKR